MKSDREQFGEGVPFYGLQHYLTGLGNLLNGTTARQQSDHAKWRAAAAREDARREREGLPPANYWNLATVGIKGPKW